MEIRIRQLCISMPRSSVIKIVVDFMDKMAYNTLGNWRGVAQFG